MTDERSKKVQTSVLLYLICNGNLFGGGDMFIPILIVNGLNIQSAFNSSGTSQFFSII